MSLIIACGCAATRPAVNGVPNFGEVAPGIYRGGQPNADGWFYLKSLGVTNVVKLNLDSEGQDPERAFMVRKFPIPFLNQLILEPRRDLVNAAVDAMVPGTFVHCSHGQDRTGLIVAEYRLRYCEWTIDAARDEMKAYGFHPELFALDRYWKESLKW